MIRIGEVGRINAVCLGALFVAAMGMGSVVLSQEAEFKPRFGILEQPPEDLNRYEQEQRALEDDGKPEGPRLIPTYFTRYRLELRRVCEAVAKDGRLPEFYASLSPQTLRDDDCQACMPFFKEFSNACRPKEKRVKPGQTPEPEVARQRELNIEAISAVTQAFSKIAEREDYLPLVMPAIDRLMILLKDPAGKTPAASEYFGALAEFAYAPFLLYVRTLETQRARLEPHEERSEQVKKEKLDSLFDFQ